jgi:very-short-patch-repair endonuclease
MSMVRDFKTQMWLKTPNGYRRIDFVLIISNDISGQKGIYIEIDDPRHNTPQGAYRDSIRDAEIFQVSFPLLRFSYNRIFNDTERVMNEIEGAIEVMRDV